MPFPSPVLRSRDPNDKLAPAGSGDAAFIEADSTLSYRIRFENQSSATGPAQRIVITDTLDANLDLDTFELTEIAFADQVLRVPAGLNHYEATVPLTVNGTPIRVEVQAGLDRASRQLTLSLRAIDPATGWQPDDPLVGLLYPNDASRRGEGYLDYRVRPRAGLASGTEIRNRARIVFDANDPIDTPLVRNTLDAAAPASRVAALPAVTRATSLTLQWSGQDEPGGSGIAGYDVFVSIDGSPYAPLVQNTRDTSGTFTFLPGHTYAFYSIARDHTGHVEATPATPDAQVLVTDASVQFSAAAYSISEAGGSAIITVTRTGTSLGAVSVRYATGGGSAVADTHYTPRSGTLNFDAGQTSLTFTIPILDNTRVEGSRTVNLTLSDPTDSAILGMQSTAVLTITDDDVAGIRVMPTAGLVTTEAGGGATFTVVLTSTPSANVTVALSSSNPNEGTVAPTLLTFTPADALLPQTVTVAGVDDRVTDGSIAYTVITAPAVSADADYDGLNAADVSVTNADNDVAGITVTPTSGLVTTEAGGTATFTVVLTSTPTAAVTIALSSSNPSEGGVAPAVLTFTPANALTPQTVTVLGVDDRSVDGDVAYRIVLAPAVSTDANYSGRRPEDVAVTNRDDDVPPLPEEDAGTPNQRYVARLYQELLERPADPAGLAHHSRLLDRGVPHALVVRGIMNSPEYRTRVVQKLYRILLGRAADAQGLRTHGDFLARGGTVEQLQRTLLGSPEYFARSGGTNQSFVAALSRDLLGRTVDPSGSAASGLLLARGFSREAVAGAVLNSPEYASALIRGYYQQYLRRPGEPTGYEAWVGARLGGLGEEEGRVGFLASGEYFARQEPSGR